MIDPDAEIFTSKGLLSSISVDAAQSKKEGVSCESFFGQNCKASLANAAGNHNRKGMKDSSRKIFSTFSHDHDSPTTASDSIMLKRKRKVVFTITTKENRNTAPEDLKKNKLILKAERSKSSKEELQMERKWSELISDRDYFDIDMSMAHVAYFGRRVGIKISDFFYSEFQSISMSANSKNYHI